MAEGSWVLSLHECHDVRLAGGKAISLARLINAGFPVPEGFVVSTHAFRHALAAGGGLPADLAREIAEAYRRMGCPAVAVRSSATAEDMAGASMAGQYQTFLDVLGEKELLDAVQRCWASLHSDRTRTYLAEHGIDPADVAMAVVVQRLVPSDVAGVLFTANPRTGSGAEMLLEASWGLGEAVVSGIVQPDTLVLDRPTGMVKFCTIGEKQTSIEPGLRARRPTPEEKRKAACLNARNVHELWHLGLRVAEHFGSAQDIEWAIHDGQLYLLQSRAITTLEDAEAYEQCLQQTRAQLRQWKHEGRGDWVRHNIAETLPHPTALTWSVIRRFMTAQGGFGAMYRAVGFEPSDTVKREGFLDLIAGRIYMDLSRGPEMFLPLRLAYDVDLLRSNPDAAQGAPTLPAGSMLQQYRTARGAEAIRKRLAALSADYDRKLQGRIIPALVRWVGREKARDLRRLTTQEWVDLWRSRESRVMDEFGPQSLLPSLICAMAMDHLRAFVEEHFWDEDAGELANLLAAGGGSAGAGTGGPDLTIQASQALYEVAAGDRSVEDWLKAYGHRAPEEFDLATPRWRESPEAVTVMTGRLKDGASPLAMYRRRVEAAGRRAEELGARLSAGAGKEFQRRLSLVHRYIRYREDGKHYLMMGYDVLRDLAVEAGRRLEIAQDVFLLSFEELHDALTTGFAPLHLIEQRRMARAAEARLSLPHVIAEADIAALGEPPHLAGSGRCTAFPISAGACTGPVRIVLSPEGAGDLGAGYVLVCPSTDPNWTPLFVNAAGLILECGGTLSHGAVVAREMGIPAVVLPDATKLLRDGETVSVDGHNGLVIRAEAAETAPEQPQPPDPADTRIPRDLSPPVRGARERFCASLRNRFLLLWAAYFAAAFLLPPAVLYQPSMDLLDAILWPVVAAIGKPLAVGAVAGALAALTMIGQRFLTDNRRLATAKRRANRLRKEAAKLPKGSPRRTALLKLAAPVSYRLVAAAMVPLAVILGPMVMSFLWMPARVDPASWNAKPGATVYVYATVHGEYLKPVTLSCDCPLAPDETTPASQSIPPIRETLLELLRTWQKRSDLSHLPWELQEAARKTREALLADLGEYLKGDVPPQDLSWTVYTPQDKPGRFTVTLTADGAEPVCVQLVLGDRYPPEFKEDLGDGKGPVQVVRPARADSPVRAVKVRYVEGKTQGDRVFWAPFAAMGWSPWDAGWLLAYIVTYVPAMFLLRWLLRIP